MVWPALDAAHMLPFGDNFGEAGLSVHGAGLGMAGLEFSQGLSYLEGRPWSSYATWRSALLGFLTESIAWYSSMAFRVLLLACASSTAPLGDC